MKGKNIKIDPDGPGANPPFKVFCDKDGVTVISHDSELNIFVKGCEKPGCFSRKVNYKGVSMKQLAPLARISHQCDQLVHYACFDTPIFRGGHAWLESRDGARMKYWGGADRNSGKCACGMSGRCAVKKFPCNCDANDRMWRSDGGLLRYKEDLPVSRLRFGDVGGDREVGITTLGKLRCRGLEVCNPDPCQNKAKCDIELSGYGRRCICAPGYSGKNCEKGLSRVTS